MTSQLPFAAMAVYSLLTASIIGLWLPLFAAQRCRPAFWNLCLLFSAAYAIGSGLLEPVALLPLAALFLCVWAAERESLPIQVRLISLVAAVGISLILMAHLAPGFVPLTIIDDVRLSPDALSYRKFLNFDKPLIGLAILAFGPRLLSTPGQWKRMLRTAIPYFPPVVIVLLLLSVALGYVRLDAKWPAFGWVWMWTNLFFTCVSEEALFRGMIQRHLQRLLNPYRHGARFALGLSAVCFGLAHFAGGFKYVILATVAGWGYGIIFQRTGSIEASILTHFGLNTVHFIFFTYPALASALN